jgi:hypothetical protein
MGNARIFFCVMTMTDEQACYKLTCDVTQQWFNLFIVDLTTLTVAQTIQRRMMG